MTYVVVDPVVERYITSRAIEASSQAGHEVYGWLVGYDDREGNIYVLGVMDCFSYVAQSRIEATPDPEEFQLASSAVIQGMGLVGIYHTHPSGVFHSEIDNITLNSLSRMYPGAVSVVTNGRETRYYQKSGATVKEVTPKYEKPPTRRVVKFTLPLEAKKVPMGVKGDIHPSDPRPLVSTYLQTALLQSFTKPKYRYQGRSFSPRLGEPDLGQLPHGAKLEVQVKWRFPKREELPLPPNLRAKKLVTMKVKMELSALLATAPWQKLAQSHEAIRAALLSDLIGRVRTAAWYPDKAAFIPGTPLTINYMGFPLRVYTSPSIRGTRQHTFCTNLLRVADRLSPLHPGYARALLQSLYAYFTKVGDNEAAQMARLRLSH